MNTSLECQLLGANPDCSYCDCSAECRLRLIFEDNRSEIVGELLEATKQVFDERFQRFRSRYVPRSEPVTIEFYPFPDEPTVCFRLELDSGQSIDDRAIARMRIIALGV